MPAGVEAGGRCQAVDRFLSLGWECVWMKLPTKGTNTDERNKIMIVDRSNQSFKVEDQKNNVVFTYFV